jgi:hypothetical protein
MLKYAGSYTTLHTLSKIPFLSFTWALQTLALSNPNTVPSPFQEEKGNSQEYGDSMHYLT